MSERPQEEMRDKGGEAKGSPSMRGSKSVRVKKRRTQRRREAEE